MRLRPLYGKNAAGPTTYRPLPRLDARTRFLVTGSIARGNLMAVHNAAVFFSQAWRAWQGARGVALLAATALAIGIGSTTAIYSVVNAVMLKPLPYRDGDRFVALAGGALNDPIRRTSLQSADAQTYQDRT